MARQGSNGRWISSATGVALVCRRPRRRTNDAAEGGGATLKRLAPKQLHRGDRRADQRQGDQQLVMQEHRGDRRLLLASADQLHLLCARSLDRVAHFALEIAEGAGVLG